MRVGAVEASEDLERLPHDAHTRELLELAAIVESSEDAILSKDLDGRIRSWNVGAERLYGYPRAEAVGRHISMLAPPERVDEIPMIIERIRRGERVEHFETRRRRKDGREVYVSLTVSPVRDEDGTIVAASVIARDVTGRHEAEAALKASQLRLREALDESRSSHVVAETARREAEALAQRLRDIRKVVDVAFSHSSLDDLLHGLLRHVHGSLESDATAIMLVDEDQRFEQRVAVGLAKQATIAIFAAVGQSLTHRVVERHAPIVLEDTAGLGQPAPGRGVRSVVGVPLLVHGQFIGSLSTGQLEPRIFTRDEIQLLQLAADHAAVAIDNARLYEQTQSIAEALQRSLLPKQLPSSSAASVAARYLPAQRGMEIGGDWYDAVELQDGRLALTIGDVVGHGIESAAAMGKFRHALRGFALEGHGPSSAIGHLRRVVEEEDMATLLYLLFDPATLSARFLSAGHPPPLVVGPDGTPTYLKEGRTTPLGAPADASSEDAEVEIEIEPGSLIVLYTDGLVERRGLSIDVGLERLADVATAAQGTVEEQLSTIIAELVGRGRRNDDVALIALKVPAANAPQA